MRIGGKEATAYDNACMESYFDDEDEELEFHHSEVSEDDWDDEDEWDGHPE